MKRATCILAALALLLGGVGQARADLITYTFTGTATGTIGSSSFVNDGFTISLVADTGNVSQLFPGVFVVSPLVTLDLAGIGSADFLIPTLAFDNQNVSALGFTRSPNGPDLLDFQNTSFASYDLRSAHAPVFVGDPFVNDLFAIPTTLGNVSFTSIHDVTFAATTAAPSPSPLASPWPVRRSSRSPGTSAGGDGSNPYRHERAVPIWKRVRPLTSRRRERAIS